MVPKPRTEGSRGAMTQYARRHLHDASSVRPHLLAWLALIACRGYAAFRTGHTTAPAIATDCCSRSYRTTAHASAAPFLQHVSEPSQLLIGLSLAFAAGALLQLTWSSGFLVGRIANLPAMAGSFD